MTRIESSSPSRGLAAALGAGLIGALLLAAPAQAQRVSLDSLSGDHDEILNAQNQGANPISACGNIDTPGAHVVVENLNAVGDCLVVTVDHVSIDLGGHVLTGDGTGNGVTSNSSDDFPRRDIAVRNGTLTGFSNGVLLIFYKSILIEGVRAVGNAANGIDLSESSGSIVHGNLALDNGRFGIVAFDSSTVSGNTVVNSGADGINGGGLTVTGNTVSGSGRFGIRLVCPSNAIGNTVFGSTNANLSLVAVGCGNFQNVAP